jgi:hypothetical protein
MEDLVDLPESSTKSFLLRENIDAAILKIIDQNPGATKQFLVEKLIQDNPLHKNEIFSIVSETVENQMTYFKETLSDKNFAKLTKQLTKEDLKDLYSLDENRSIDQIKTVSSVNKSHNDLLIEIKRKASQMSINNPSYPDQIKNIYQEPSINNQESSSDKQFSSSHLEDTMNLFD